jgi:hypothetical protein
VALAWARQWQAGIAVDHKHELTPAHLPGWQLVQGFRTALAQWGPEHPRLIVRPIRGDLEPDGPYDQLAERVLLHGRVGWLNDEVHNVAPGGRMQAGFERLWLEGRSRQVPVIAATTRPMHVHNSLLANATHIVAFQLLLDGDRRKLAGFMGERLLERDLLAQAHSFAHWRADTSELVVYGPLPI